MKIFVAICFFILLFNITSKALSNGEVLYNQAIEFLKKNDYKNAFIYFSIACYNNYIPGCDMMGPVEYQIDKNKGEQISKNWVKTLSKSKNQLASTHLKQVLKYYIDIYKQLNNKELSNYFQKTYNKLFLHIEIEKINPHNGK
ncbi:MAG: hypothetical protein ACPLW6_02835 [Desulfurella sp.]|jgi:thiol-disulfide isomerase/thioredoxin|uniref:Sel1 repeat-containing protein n=2 Tax=Desulfurella TaxID=33001 RepID=A0A1G6QFJ9_9BACT|nr:MULTISPECIES: hypothetical protein [Desulfurella]PMP87341.1 MAG: hypothetical protein C0173_09405 [Desulfurella sp.]SDC90466.1 hypothetical protein SAMN05660835_01567 [Desulfurella multipotens]